MTEGGDNVKVLKSVTYCHIFGMAPTVSSEEKEANWIGNVLGLRKIIPNLPTPAPYSSRPLSYNFVHKKYFDTECVTDLD